MKTTTDSYADRCGDAIFRIAKIIHVAASGLGDALTEDMEEIALERPDVVLPGWSEVVAKEMGRHYDERDMLEEFGCSALWRQDSRLGFLVLAEHPSWDRYPMFSWGFCTAEWFYGETYDEAFNAAEAWAQAGPEAGLTAAKK